MATDEYIGRILKARVYDVAVESPLEAAPRLSRRIGNQVLLKREDLQPVFSFKLRGAYNKIAHLSESVARRGVICASAGNHAQGVALAAQRRGIPAIIVMPQTTPSIKVTNVTLSPINQCSLARNASMICRVQKMNTPVGEAFKEPFVRRERPSQLRMPS